MGLLTRSLHLLMAAALLVLLAGCQPAATTSSPDQFFSTATVTRGAMADVVQAAGQVVSQDARLLSFSTIGGRVVEVKVRPGQAVQSGQALVRLDTADQERQLRQALADLKVSEGGRVGADWLKMNHILAERTVLL